MEIREANLDDYDQIEDLHLRNNIKILDKKSWIDFWKTKPKIKNSQNDTPIGWVLEKEKHIVGFLGNIIKEYFLKNEKLIVACSHAWVVDEKFRLNSFLLTEKFFSQDYIDLFISSTPNKTSEKIFLRYGANKLLQKNFNKNFFLILNLEKFLNSIFKFKKIPEYKFVNLTISWFFKIFFFNKINYWKKFNFQDEIIFSEKMNSNFENLWEVIKKKNNRLMQSKSPDWINWHIKMFKKVWIVTLQHKNQTKGYAIFCERNNENYQLKRTSIIDVVSIDNDNEVYLSLLNSCIKKSHELGYYVIDMIGTDKFKKELFSVFKTFNRKIPEYLFYYYSRNKSLMKKLSNEDIWDTTLLDGDTYLF